MHATITSLVDITCSYHRRDNSLCHFVVVYLLSNVHAVFGIFPLPSWTVTFALSFLTQIPFSHFLCFPKRAAATAREGPEVVALLTAVALSLPMSACV